MLYEALSNFLCFHRVIVNGFQPIRKHIVPFFYEIFKKKNRRLQQIGKKAIKSKETVRSWGNAIDRQNNIVGRIFGHIFVPKRNIIRGTSMFTTIEHMLRITPDLHLQVPVLYMARV